MNNIFEHIIGEDIKPEYSVKNTIYNFTKMVSAFLLVLAITVVIIPRFFEIDIQPFLTWKFGMYALLIFICAELVYVSRQEVAIQEAKNDETYKAVKRKHDEALEDVASHSREAFDAYCRKLDEQTIKSKRVAVLRRFGVLNLPDDVESIAADKEKVAKLDKRTRRAVWFASHVRIKPLNASKLLISCDAIGEITFLKGSPVSPSKAKRGKTLFSNLPALITTFVGAGITFSASATFNPAAVMSGILQVLFILSRVFSGDKDGRKIVLIDTVAYLEWRTNIYNGFLMEEKSLLQCQKSCQIGEKAL